MNNKEFYTDTFNEIHVSAAVLGKVRDMKMEKTTVKRKNRLRYAVSAVAALALFLVASNGICYAATGNTWIQKVTIYINGEAEEADVTFHKEGDNLVGEITREVDGGKESHVIMTDGDVSDIDGKVEFGNEKTYLMSEDNKIYLMIGDEPKKIDITEDFADGKCSGTVELEDGTYSYEVTGTIEEYGVNLSNVSND